MVGFDYLCRTIRRPLGPTRSCPDTNTPLDFDRFDTGYRLQQPIVAFPEETERYVLLEIARVKLKQPIEIHSELKLCGDGRRRPVYRTRSRPES